MTPPIANRVGRGVFEGIALPSPVARKSSRSGLRKYLVPEIADQEKPGFSKKPGF